MSIIVYEPVPINAFADFVAAEFMFTAPWKAKNGSSLSGRLVSAIDLIGANDLADLVFSCDKTCVLALSKGQSFSRDYLCDRSINTCRWSC